MKYLVVGAGALGSLIAATLTNAGKDVTLISRGANLDHVREHGLTVEMPDGTTSVSPVRVVAESDYDDRPDVVLVCVKSYSLTSVLPLIDRVVTSSTVVLPVTNSLKVLGIIQDGISTRPLLAQGLTYIAVVLNGPGHVKRKLDFFNMVLGVRKGEDVPAALEVVCDDLRDAGANVTLSRDVLAATIEKFIRVSALSAAQVYFDADAGAVRNNPEAWEFLEQAGNELRSIAVATSSPVPEDAVKDLLEVVSGVLSSYTTSLMHDYKGGRQTEAESQFFDVYDLGRSLGLPMKAYGAVSRKLGHEPAVSA